MNIAGLNNLLMYSANKPNVTTKRKKIFLQLVQSLVYDPHKIRATWRNLPKIQVTLSGIEEETVIR